MYVPKSVLSRLLGAAWTILLIAVLLWLAVQLLAKIWIWLVVILILVVLVRIGCWLHRSHRDDW